jgi:hypothetical protein
MRRLAFNEGVPSGHDLEFYRVSMFGRIDEQRDRQRPVEARRFTLREATASETPDEAARCDRGGPDCKLASIQHRVQTEASFY